jgi:hypothetical protein
MSNLPSFWGDESLTSPPEHTLSDEAISYIRRSDASNEDLAEFFRVTVSVIDKIRGEDPTQGWEYPHVLPAPVDDYGVDMAVDDVDEWDELVICSDLPGHRTRLQKWQVLEWIRVMATLAGQMRS